MEVDTSTIVILDFGSQYTQLIARRIREFNVFSVVLPCTAPLAKIKALAPLGIILSGGPLFGLRCRRTCGGCRRSGAGWCRSWASAMDCSSSRITWAAEWRPAPSREYGHAEVRVVRETALFRGLPATLNVWMSHGDHASALAPGFEVTAETANAVAGIADEARKMWAVQFHPEVAHTPQGMELLRNFVLDICGAKADWTPEHFIQTTVERLCASRSAMGTRSAR